MTTDIFELFARDPQKHSDTDIQEMVAYFRSKRHLFNSGVSMAGKTKPSTAKPDVVEAAKGLSLKSLGL